MGTKSSPGAEHGQQNVADAEQSTRIDRLAERVERIETRLELRE
jgi:hypothetical protein